MPASSTPSGFSKTKMCKFHLAGRCTRGEACVFAHGVDDLQPLPDFSRTKLCKTLLSHGRCDDPQCTFAHSKEQLRASRLQGPFARQLPPVVDPKVQPFNASISPQLAALYAQTLNQNLSLWSAASTAIHVKDHVDECDTSSGTDETRSSTSERSLDVMQEDGFLQTRGRTTGPTRRSLVKLLRSAEGNLSGMAEDPLRTPALKLVRSADGELCAMDDDAW